MINIKIQPHPISHLLIAYDDLKEGNTITIFVTDKQYNFSPTLTLNILDVMDGEEGFIDLFQLKAIKDTLINEKNIDTILIGCDAGLSRSPAIASAIALLHGDIKVSEKLRKYYRFYNEDIYKFIIKYWKDV